MTIRTRFAPSPTGRLHLGHAYSAWCNAHVAAEAGGAFMVRIEDLDSDRVRPEFESGILDDLAWLGLSWVEPVRRQSEHLDMYQAALDELAGLGVLYPCSCLRRDIRAALGPDPVFGPDGVVYPGTCRGRSMSDARAEDALRLNMKKAVDLIGSVSFFDDGPVKYGHHIYSADHMINKVGDVVLRRRLTRMPAYHLAVTVDDAHQQVTDVVRGADLFEATAIHLVLQRLLALPSPRYHHHRLIVDETGKRLAKSHDSRAIAAFRDAGDRAGDVWARVAAQMPEVTPLPVS